MAEPEFYLLHLSDLHFREGQFGDFYDLNQDIRNELLYDLRQLVEGVVPRFDALAITGDIAFAGRATEYQIASSWIRSLADTTRCPIDRVLVVPGNHDIDRAIIAADADLAALQRQLKTSGTYEAELTAALRNNANGLRLISPMAAYNSFANAHGCAVSPQAICWQRSFDLGPAHKLTFRGLTTTLVSGPDDDLPNNLLLLGAAQALVQRSSNVVHVTLAHHPPEFLRDGDSAQASLSLRTALQLFGHKHQQRVRTINGSVYLQAGALHPDRLPGWEPRYNVIRFKVVPSPTGDNLSITLFPRKWSEEEGLFMADFNSRGEATREFAVALPGRQATHPPAPSSNQPVV